MEAAFMDSGTTVDKVIFGSVFCSAAIMAVIALIRRNLTLCAVFPFLAPLSPPTSRQQQGENARLSSFIGAIAIADLVKTTLGPKGMDKILQRISEHDQSVSVTNDGATILKSINLDNAAAKVLVDIARVQDDEVGDGTTSVAVLCGELL
jgi:hypothetical protein